MPEKLTKAKLTDMLAQMMLIRKFEEQVQRYFFETEHAHGTAHLYIGEEACAVGVCAALEPDDLITSTHRGHGHCIAKGMSVSYMMAEFMGKADGYCQGKGGSMHIADIRHGHLGANGIVGGGHGIATGAALALQMKGAKQMVVCFFGDGASNEGSFHEALNLASIWKLPVLFVCEDNGYGMSMSRQRSMNISDISQRAQSYGILGNSVDGNDVLAVYEQTQASRQRVLNQGPELLVCRTYRWCGHSKSDKNVYRTTQEIQSWQKKDPLVRFRDYLLEHQVLTEDAYAQLDGETTLEIQKAVDFARQSPYPPLHSLTGDVYA